MNKDPVYSFQEAELNKYSCYSYQKLKSMVGRVNIEPPNDLQTHTFVRSISEKSNTHIEVRILRIIDRNMDFTDEDIANAIDVTAEDFEWPEDIDENAEIITMESASGPWFTINLENHIEWPSFEHDDDD